MAATVINSALTTISKADNVTNWSGTFITSSATTYISGYDPYIKQKRIMTDALNRNLKIGQLIMTTYFAVGLIVNFTKGGNPRCIIYNEDKEELGRYTHDGKKAGEVYNPTAWTEHRCYILREAGDPRTVLPPGLVIQKGPVPF